MYVTDTHALLWFLNQSHRHLSPRVLSVFGEAQKGNCAVYVPSIVLVEIALLNSKGKIQLNRPFLRWAEELKLLKRLSIYELNHSVISDAVGYGFNDDIFDKLIVATTAELDVPLITRDVAITDSKLVEVYW